MLQVKKITSGKYPELSNEKLYEVSDIQMSSSNTSIFLENCELGPYNSIHFTFYKNGKKHDIFKDPEFNPYYKV